MKEWEVVAVYSPTTNLRIIVHSVAGSHRFSVKLKAEISQQIEAVAVLLRVGVEDWNEYSRVRSQISSSLIS